MVESRAQARGVERREIGRRDRHVDLERLPHEAHLQRVREFETARREAGGGNAALDLPSSPAVAPPDGYLDPTALGLLSRTTTTIISDAMLSDRPRRQSPVLGLADGKRLVFADAQAATGGPLPGPQVTPLQERQRILSDAALRLLSGEGPLVVTLPTEWEPGSPVDAEEFFTGLRVPWLHLTSLRQIARTTPADIDAEQLRYPTARAEEELPSTNFEAAGDLLAAGEITQSMLPTNHTLAIETTHQALTVTSYGARARPMVQTELAMRSRDRLERLTAQVTVEAPRSVTLSSESGQFSAIVTNSLEQRVSVRVVARTDGQLRIKDSPVVELAPGEVRSIELTARSSKLGLHDVRLAVADVNGVPLGASDDFQLRAAQVSNVIWVVFAVGGVLLFGANIWLIAQTYNINSHFPDGTLLWGVGALAAALAVPSRASLGAALAIGGLWTWQETMDFHQVLHLPFLVFWAACAANAAWLSWRPGIHLSALSLIMWFIISHEGLQALLGWSDVEIVSLYVFLPLAIWSVSQIRDPGPNAIRLMVSHYAFFVFMGAFSAIHLFDGHLVGPDGSWVAFAAGSTLIALGAVVLSMQRGGANAFDLGGTAFAAAVTSVYVATVIEHQGQSDVFYLACTLVIILWSLFRGARMDDRFVVNWSVVAFALWVLYAYFDLFAGLLDQAIFFTVGGVLLIVLALALEPLRRNLVTKR